MITINFPDGSYPIDGSNSVVVNRSLSNFDKLLRKLIYLRSVGIIPDNFTSVIFNY